MNTREYRYAMNRRQNIIFARLFWQIAVVLLILEALYG